MPCLFGPRSDEFMAQVLSEVPRQPDLKLRKSLLEPLAALNNPIIAGQEYVALVTGRLREVLCIDQLYALLHYFGVQFLAERLKSAENLSR